jgi:hypothetical protein
VEEGALVAIPTLSLPPAFVGVSVLAGGVCSGNREHADLLQVPVWISCSIPAKTFVIVAPFLIFVLHVGRDNNQGGDILLALWTVVRWSL